jgi:peptidoglycan/LPS O-acetylase OafA/YrhL
MLLLADHADDLVEVVSLGSLLSLISVVPVYWVTRNQIKWNFVLWIAPPELAFTVVGGMVLFLTPSDIAKKVLGGVFLLFAVCSVGGIQYDWTAGMPLQQLSHSVHFPGATDLESNERDQKHSFASIEGMDAKRIVRSKGARCTIS